MTPEIALLLAETLAALTAILLLLIMLCGLGHAYLIAIYQRCARRSVTEPFHASAPVSALPDVLIQIPVYNEPAVAVRAIAAAARLDWPRERLHIQVLDDSADETMALARSAIADLRRDGIDAELVRRSGRAGFKAGALQNGLAFSSAPFVAIFDADYEPEPDWLGRALPPLLADGRLAFVQTRLTYRNARANWLTRAQALLSDLYCGFEQPARASAGLPVPFNGTCAVWCRAAINDVGGWSSDTLAEDMDISYRVFGRGWRSLYLTAVTVAGELPGNWTSLQSQQYRWTKGATQAFGKTLATVWPQLGWSRRILFVLKGFSDSFLGMLILGAAAAGAAYYAVTGATHPALNVSAAAAIALHLFVRLRAMTLSARTVGRARDGRFVADIGLAACCEALLLLLRSKAALSAVLGRDTPFVRTEKHGA